MLDNFRTLVPLLVSIGLSACLQEKELNRDVVGTSIGTGNPGKLKVSFTEDGTVRAFSGVVEVYASTQITIPYYQPDPLIRFAVENSVNLEIPYTIIRSLPDTVWPASSRRGDSAVLFNFVLKGDTRGALIQGLALNVKKNHFQWADESYGTRSNALQSMDIELLPLEILKAELPQDWVIPDSYLYAFAYGTGYFARWDGEHFLFPPMPRQSYELSIIAWPDPATAPGSSWDSTYVYRSSPAVLPGRTDTLDSRDILEKVRIPDEFISK